MQQDYRRALDLALRAVDYGDSIESLAAVGRQIVHTLSVGRDQIPVNIRRIFTGSIIDRLEKLRDELIVPQIVDLGWLYLVSGDNQSAEKAATDALSTEPRNGRARDLLDRSTNRRS
jgi:hypothetical protein